MGFLGDLFKSAPGKIIGGIVGGIPGAIVGGAGDLLLNELIGKPNAQDAYEKSMAASANAYARSKEAYAERYQVTARDMKAAGLNPILAASGGFSVGNAPQMATAQSFQPHTPYGSSVGSALGYAQAEKTQEETKKIHEEIGEVISRKELNAKRIIESIGNNLLKRSQAKLASIQEKRTFQEILNLEQDFLYRVKEFDKLREETGLLIRGQQVKKEEIQRIRAQKDMIEKQAKTLTANLQKLAAIAEIYKQPAGKLLAVIREVLGVVNVGFIKGLK